MAHNLADWFLGKPAEQPFEQGTSSRRRRRLSPEPQAQPATERKGTDYAAQYVEKEMQSCLQVAAAAEKLKSIKIQGPGMDQFEEDPNYQGSDNLSLRAAVYEEFSFAPAKRDPLAIDSYKDELLKILKARNALVVKGFTGCGKTTQVPQFILDSCAATKTPCNIIVTQPRRIAAISVAKRVSQERGWELGTVVGYHVGMERRAKDFTCITYMTTGCLLEMLVAKKSLSGFTHIIVDEVHERDEDTDILLLVIRKLWWKLESSTKVILMSATVDASKFAIYFMSLVSGMKDPAPVINVANAPPFAVAEYYLDDLRSMTALGVPVPDDTREPMIDEKAYDCAASVIAALDKNREILRYGRVPEQPHLARNRGAVLIFLPGLAEIETMHKHLQMVNDQSEPPGLNNWLILPLHSRVTGEEQSRVFQVPPSTCRKIILATNIAESSITVPDIVYVVDFCLVRQLVVDEQNNFPTLKLNWAPRSNCIQRKGRVGRVSDGIVYRMISKNTYDYVLDEDVKAELLRCPLENSILRVKLLDMGEPKALLALALEPPDWLNIDRTILTLKEVGALTLTADGNLAITPDDGDLSYLGRVIARLPLDIHLGKLIMLGYIFNVLEECIIMAAGLGSKNIFTSPYDNTRKLGAYYLKMSWAEGSFSDPMTILNAYQYWKTRFESNEYSKKDRKEEIEWARTNNIQLKALKDMDCLVREIKFRLNELGIEPATGPNMPQLRPLQKAFLYRVVLFGAFYPQFFGRSAGQIDEREAVKELVGCDPFNTIKLSGWKMEQNGKAYIGQLRYSLDNLLSVLKDPTWRYSIKFDSSRVFVQFYQEGNSSVSKKIPGRVAMPVYLAVKQKRLQTRQQFQDHFYRIGFLNPQDAEIYAQQVEELAKRILSTANGMDQWPRNIPDFSSMLRMKPPRFPEVGEEDIPIMICHVEEPNHFWIQRTDDVAYADMKQMAAIIRSNMVKEDIYHLNIDHLVLAPYSFIGDKGTLETLYFRSKIITFDRNAAEVKVYFIDYGNCADVKKTDLYKLPPPLLHFPPLAIECYWTAIGPSLIADPKGQWIPEAHEYVQQFVDAQLKAKIYSIVNGVMSIDARTPDHDNWEQSICNVMVQRNFADRIEEPCCSRLDHEERVAARAVNNAHRLPIHQEKEYAASRRFNAELMATEFTKFPREKIQYTIALNGPNSPLEVKMFGKVKSLASCSMTIDDDSVNSVLLDGNPEGKHERFLIAAQVSSSSDGNRVRVRQTTLLPAMPGLSSILSLIFAPRVEFRANSDRTRLTGALCGLGKKEDGTAIYPDHDMELEFDTDISVKDVLVINKIRHFMNSVLAPQSFGCIPPAPSADKVKEISSKCLKGLFSLMRPRSDLEAVASKHTHKWNKIELGHLVRNETPEDHVLNLLPQHDYINIVPKTEGPK